MFSIKHIFSLTTTCVLLSSIALSARAELLQHSDTLILDPSIHGISIPAHGVVTDDSEKLYVLGSLTNAIAVFQRDPTDNTLSAITSYTDTNPNFDGLLFPWKAALSRTIGGENRYLFVISRSSQITNDTHPDTLAVFERDTGTGELSFVDVFEDAAIPLDMDLPGDLVVSSDANYVYVTGVRSNSVAVFSFDAASGQLALEQTVRNGDSTSGGIISNLVSPQALTMSPDGRHIYIAGHDANAVVIFSRDSATGLLTYETAVTNTDPVAGLVQPIDIAISQDGNFVFTANPGNRSVAVFRRDSATGNLQYINTYSDQGAGVDVVDSLEGITALHISPDDQYLIALSSLVDNALTVFSVDRNSDQLGVSQVIRDEGLQPLAIESALGFLLTRDKRGAYTLSSNGMIGIFDSCAGIGPTANAGDNIRVAEGESQPVQLDASASVANCDVIASYSWQQLEGPAVTLANATTAMPSFTAPAEVTQETDLVFEVTVANSFDAFNTATVTVTVTNANNPPQVADDLCIVAPGDRVTIDVLQNDTDIDGQPLQVVAPDPLPTLEGNSAFSPDNIRYTAPGTGNFPLIESFTYKATDTIDESINDGNVEILVNELPDIQDDVYNGQTDEPRTLDINASNWSPDTDLVILLPESGQTENGGQLELTSDGEVLYTPPASRNFSTDSFIYSAVSAATYEFATENNLQLFSDNTACSQSSGGDLTTTGRVTINFVAEVTSEKPGGSGGTNIQPRSSGGGGGALMVFDLIALLMAMILRARRSAGARRYLK
ncbi:MAG: beta-propeller fold lactonase family protein [Gammaproteobacteria bacterium]|jgi:6-phosphogluconolactonase (cycloisomerase 2 family)